MDIVEDGGFEAAIHFLAAESYELAETAACSYNTSNSSQSAAAAAGIAYLEEEEEYSSLDSSDDYNNDQDGTAELAAAAAAVSHPGGGGGVSGNGSEVPFEAGTVVAATTTANVGVSLNPNKVATDAVVVVNSNQSKSEAVNSRPWGLTSWELMEDLVRESALGDPELVLRSTQDIQHGE